MAPTPTTQMYYSAAGTRRGPISYTEFLAHVDAKLIHSDDLVWYEGLPDWVRADTVVHFPDRAFAEPITAPAAEAVAPTSTSTPRVDKQRANYFVRHWRGELSLPVSYWLNNVLAAVIVFAAFLGFASLLDADNPVSAIAFWTFATVLYVLVTIWQLVGAWRSAVRRNAESRSVWASLAQVGIVFGWISVLGTLGNTMVPGIKESVAQYEWLQTNGKWQVEVLRDGREVALTGGIGPGFATDVQAILDRQPRLETLHVNLQNGGLVGEADKARRAIQARGISTYVSETCVSACTIVLAGGKQRYANPRAKIGFHAPKVPGVSNVDNRNSFTRTAYADAGIADDFIGKVLATPSTTMWYPKAPELEEGRVLTAVVSGDEFGISNVKELVASGKVREVLLGIKLYAAVNKVDPQLFAQLVSKSEQGYLAGKTPAEVRSDNLPTMVALRKQYVRTTSDSAVTALANVAMKQYLALSDKPEACVAYAVGRPPEKAAEAVGLIPTHIRQEEADVFARVIEESGQKDAFVPNEAQSKRLHQEVFRQATADDQGRKALLNFLSAADGKPHDARLACMGMLSILVEAKRLPQGLAPVYFRMFFSES